MIEKTLLLLWGIAFGSWLGVRYERWRLIRLIRRRDVEDPS